MTAAQGVPAAAGDGLPWRLALWAALVLGWLIMLLYMWSAFSTFPTAERLEHSRMMPIPSLRTLGLFMIRSGLELGAVLALLWPWQARAFLVRMVTAALLLATWFFVTTPLTLSMMHWVHRRWLAAMVVGLLLCAVAALPVRLFLHRRRDADG
jgi:hypothetical protein